MSVYVCSIELSAEILSQHICRHTHAGTNLHKIFIDTCFIQFNKIPDNRNVREV